MSVTFFPVRMMTTTKKDTIHEEIEYGDSVYA